MFSLFVCFILTSPAEGRSTTCYLLLYKDTILSSITNYTPSSEAVSTNFIFMHNHNISGQKESDFLCSFNLFTCFYPFFL